jgi:hypothetical protein
VGGKESQMTAKDKKELEFSIKSAKGNEVEITYTPSPEVKVSDVKAFEKYLGKIVDFIQIDDKPVVKAEVKEEPLKPKTIEAVASEVKESEVKKDEAKTA